MSKDFLDLSGYWTLRLDPDDVGISEEWFRDTFSTPVRLPGSLDENGIGTINNIQADLSGLSRKVRYVGIAWYERTVEVPDEWIGTSLTLEFERVHWFSDIWVNELHMGHQDSLSVSHRYDIASLESNIVHIVIRIDNTPHIPVGRIGHALTDWTQTNWNGVIGKMELRLGSATIENLSVTTLEGVLRVSGVASVDGDISVEIIQENYMLSGTSAGTKGEAFSLSFELTDVASWENLAPNLIDVKVSLGGFLHHQRVGKRTVGVSNKTLLFNSQPLFLRGTLECCVFPKTGYPPSDVESWLKIMKKVEEFGLNHVRFHSWCPPEEAFVAADEVGIYLQVELPVWTGLWAVSSVPSLLAFCRNEAHRILRTYGHHPSFILFALGNEIAFYGSEPAVDDLIQELKEKYPSQLFTFSAQGTHLSPVCDFYVQADNGKPGAENLPLRGSTWFGVGSRFDREVPNTLVTCDEAAEQFDRPVISHEVAEWAVFPDVTNTANYDGVLEPRNFKTIAAMLTSRGLIDRAGAFVQASGKLSAKLYKEEIETLLRTKGMSGYQLLGLTDFPGQGTATVGMLDAFWDEKGFVNGEEFRQFCGETVPLLVYPRVIWHTDESFLAEARVFHSGRPFEASLTWAIRDEAGVTFVSGELPVQALSPGKTTTFGKISFPLSQLSAPNRYHIELEIAGQGRNSWTFWIYPSELSTPDLSNVYMAEFYRQDVREAIKNGKRIWLKLNPKRLWSGIPGRFAPAFWSPIHFKEQVGTMGTLIDSRHPIFNYFPTESFTDWQWWDVLTHSKAMVLNELPLDYQPILQVIDRYERNDKLGTILECQIGDAKILITMIDFNGLEDRPASRQLQYSIQNYLQADDFAPTAKLTILDLDSAFSREP